MLFFLLFINAILVISVLFYSLYAFDEENKGIEKIEARLKQQIENINLAIEARPHLSMSSKKRFRGSSEEISEEINTLVNDYHEDNFYEYTKQKLEEKTRVIGILEGQLTKYDEPTEEKKAAIGLAMMRNMSHNIGSHVLSRMVQEDDFNGDGFYQPNRIQKDDSNEKGVAKPEIEDNDHLLSVFASYLKSRMDFLADITSGNTAIAESSKYLFGDIFLGLNKNKLLLNKISGTDKFHYKIVIRNLTNILESDLEHYCPSKPENEHLIIKRDGHGIIIGDVLVCIPNDVLGYHAFYVIIENIIRNSAKHGTFSSLTKEKPLAIYIDICKNENAPDLYQIYIYDYPTSETICHKNNILGNRTFAEIDNLCKEINDKINTEILKGERLRPQGLGIIEMEASASYLRKISIDQIDAPQYIVNTVNYQNITSKNRRFSEINILKAVPMYGKFLGYRLFLAKPKELLIIDDLKLFYNVPQKEIATLQNQGINILSYENFSRTEKVYSHKIVLFLSNKELKIKDKERIGSRILELSEEKVVMLDLFQKSAAKNVIQVAQADFLNNVWLAYMKSKNDNYKFLKSYKGLVANSVIQQPFIDSLEGAKEGSAIFLSHGRNFVENAKQHQFVEIDYSTVLPFKPNVNDKIKLYNFIESVHLHITVLDERIQEYADSAFYNAENGAKIKYRSIYEKTNIYVPTNEECNIQTENFENQAQKIVKYMRIQCKSCHFMIIHLGVIEKMIKTYNESQDRINSNSKEYDKLKEVGDYLKEVVFEGIEFNFNRIVITSGRGVPNGLPSYVRYLNYSIVAQYLIDMRYKYLLSEALFSARKNNVDR